MEEKPGKPEGIWTGEPILRSKFTGLSVVTVKLVNLGGGGDGMGESPGVDKARYPGSWIPRRASISDPRLLGTF